MLWQTSRFQIDLTIPKVMGIVNVTPDSFSDGGLHGDVEAALRHCEQLIHDGADILDIGGESSRPGAEPLGTDDELARVLPVVREAAKWGLPVSVDTYKPQVMQAVLDLGADIINDIWALRWHDTTQSIAQATGLQVIAAHASCGVCLMHMHREPQTMQMQPMHGDAPAQIRLFLERCALDLQSMGVEKSRIAIDPGIGFGKTAAQNFSLLAHQSALLDLGYAVLVGWSRKSSLATMTAGPQLSASERLIPSVAAALLAAQKGAHVLRVHDVKETVQALKVLVACGSGIPPLGF